jgi:acyl-coenzyme A thioesterase PaaI-like protein
METLNIEYIDAEAGFLVARMPVLILRFLHQPMGFVHGDIRLPLAESVGSAASLYIRNTEVIGVV